MDADLFDSGADTFGEAGNRAWPTPTAHACKEHVICRVPVSLVEVGMRRTEQRQGVRMLKLRDVLTRWEAG
jgi:hypothetical protein